MASIRPRGSVLHLAATSCAWALIAVGCSTSTAPEVVDDVPSAVGQASADASKFEPTESATAPVEPTTEPEPTPEPAKKLTLLDQEFVTATAEKVAPLLSDGVFLLATIDAAGTTVAGASGTDSAGNTPTSIDPFRVGSVTKVFTAVAVLTLVDEGLVDLDTPAAEYVSRVAVPEGVTVRHLLQHTSGIFNYTDNPDLVGTAITAPARVWRPEDIYEQFVDRPVMFDPGRQFHYSNTNYLILGLLIEEVAGQRYDQVVRERIFDPLGLSSSTYIAGVEDGPEPFDRYEHEGQADYDYTSIATGSWSAGSLVSSAQDLHVFFTALFDDQLVSAALVEEMTEGVHYGLGLELVDLQRYGVYGHRGAILGYLTTVRFSPDLGVTAFLVLTDSQTQPNFAITDMLNAFKNLSASSDDS